MFRLILMDFEKGHYMLFKNPDVMMLGDNAGFALNLASARQYCEMRFWYMRDSDNSGELNIKMREALGDEFTVLKTVNSVARVWTRERVTIPARLNALQVSLEYSRP